MQAGPASGMGLDGRVTGGAVQGSSPLYRVNDGRRRGASVRGWLGTAACERLESQLGAPSAACACARGRTGWPGGVRGSGRWRGSFPWPALDLSILRAGSGSGRAKKSPVFFLAARARPDPVAGL